MITRDHKRSFHKVRKAEKGGAQDVQYQSARLHNRLEEEMEERSDLGYVSHSSSPKRLSQLMPATRDKLFTHLSNQ